MQSAQVVGLCNLAHEFLEHAHVGEESGEHRVALPCGLGLCLGKFEIVRAVEERDAEAHAGVRTGSTTVLRTLSDEDSLACWRLPFAGAERVIICRDGLMAVAGGLELSVMSSDAGELLIFPALASPPTATGAEIEVLDAGEVTRLRWRSRIPEPTCQFENLAAGRMLVTVPPEAFDGLEDLFLSIDAIGDIGEAYIDGILVHDWFLDGRPWLMGLKRFIVPGRTLAVVLTVTPPRGESNVTYSQMAAMEVKQGGTPARIVSVRLLVERRLRLVAG